MSSYKLTYFNVTALGEPIRFLLSYLGQEFEDYRLPQDQWPSTKPKTPFGKLPILEIDGKEVHQSTAISRYLGKEAELAGSDNWEALQIDMAVDAFHDLRLAAVGYFFETDPATKEKKREPLLNVTVPFYLSKFDQLAQENNGYLANGKLSWGDIYFIACSSLINHIIEYDMFEQYENLRRLRDNVYSIPQIKNWLETRPKTPF
ncbi:glutathione S-transferase [Halyomorpha halys]|uniref:glutathione S-transferase n=1 Tax=Halyomorpha halys TaxID=286706 RepID=UPI0006D52320|nr:glutathione S-transferase [Halyomorpha halys]